MKRKKKKRYKGYQEDGFLDYQREAIRAAEDFKYGKEVIEKVETATTSDEISKIMNKARMNKKEWGRATT